ncbi:MAG: hypothetical protein WCK17_03335, partial [Verrucomicrobiota bacterium]
MIIQFLVKGKGKYKGTGQLSDLAPELERNGHEVLRGNRLKIMKLAIQGALGHEADFVTKTTVLSVPKGQALCRVPTPDKGPSPLSPQTGSTKLRYEYKGTGQLSVPDAGPKYPMHLVSASNGSRLCHGIHFLANVRAMARRLVARLYQ